MLRLKKYKKRTMKNVPKVSNPPNMDEIVDLDLAEDNPEEIITLDSPDSEKDNLEPAEVIDLDNYDVTGKKKRKRESWNKCINVECESGKEMRPVTIFCLNFYRVKIKPNKNQEICEECYEKTVQHYEDLSTALANGEILFTHPLPLHDEYVEIDSDDSGGEDCTDICTAGVTSCEISDELHPFLAAELTQVMNETFDKWEFDKQVDGALNVLEKRAEKLDEVLEEINEMEKKLQKRIDTVRSNLYAEFQKPSTELPPIELYCEVSSTLPPLHPTPPPTPTPIPPTPPPSTPPPTPLLTPLSPRKSPERRSNRNVSKPASYCELMDDETPLVDGAVAVSGVSGVVGAIREVKEENLPPEGRLERSTPVVGEFYYAQRQSVFGAWGKVKLTEIETERNCPTNNDDSTSTPDRPPTPPPVPINPLTGAPNFLYKVRFDGKKQSFIKYVNGKQMAYSVPASVRLDVGTRVIAVFMDEQSLKRESYYAGIIAEPLSEQNHFRYLVFFDDGYAQYVYHTKVLVVCEQSKNVWEDIHPDSQNFIRKYLETYPERPLVKVQPEQIVKTEWNGKWWIGRVLRVDCSLVHMYFDADNRSEWIYRGSTRLGPLFLEVQAAAARQGIGSHIPKLHQKSPRIPQPYVEYPKPLHSGDVTITSVTTADGNTTADSSTAVPRAVARKSTNRPPNTLPVATNIVPFLPTQQVQQPQSKVVYFTPKSIIAPKPYTPHTCNIDCSKLISLPLSALKGYNPLSKPLLVGWHRQMFKYKGKKGIRYRSPCGRTVRNMPELHRYLRMTHSELSVDNFDFDFWVHTLAEFVLDKTFKSKRDISNGVENVPIPCVNYVDNSLPDFIHYSTRREPKEGVSLNLDPEFLSGCDCTDDCSDKSKCACWQLTIREARTLNKRVPDELIGYTYKRLPDCVTTGIYECNPRCKCASTCLNRVVQHPLQLKLQLFKTANRGWGIRCLNDIPHGAFICIYAGSLLTDKMANEGGTNYGDEYLAELDYIEVVERQKDGYESDVEEGSGEGSDGEEDAFEQIQKDTDDFSFKSSAKVTSSIAVTTRSKIKSSKDDSNSPSPSGSTTNLDTQSETVTISDDEENVREKSSFAPSSTTEEQVSVPKFKSVRKMFGESEVCYIMDAKNTGNIGRFLNHSCSPNVFVQNVFVDTHDLRFPWVAFFAMSYIRAGTELTWNYNYDVGSVPGKVIFCHCGSPACRGRLL